MTANRKLIAGNWKMNGLKADGLDLASDLAGRLKGAGPVAFDMLVCPPFPLLFPVGEAIADSPLALGGQDCAPKTSGAHTGDVAPTMLKDAGCRFVMAEAPGAVWRDIADPNRTSATRSSESLGRWLEMMKPEIPARAYHGGRGWAYAKLVSHVSRSKALHLYLTALFRHCYSPRMAIIILAQIALGDARYRHVADAAIRWLGAGMREKRAA